AQLPWPSARLKPAMPVLVPQIRCPRCLTRSSVVWAWAAAPIRNVPATAANRRVVVFDIGILLAFSGLGSQIHVLVAAMRRGFRRGVLADGDDLAGVAHRCGLALAP